jgi:hypothetical protein
LYEVELIINALSMRTKAIRTSNLFIRYQRSIGGPLKLKETLATLGFILFFTGSMIDISGSLFVTEGGTPAPTYFKVGIMEAIGTVIFLVGIYLIVKTR